MKFMEFDDWITYKNYVFDNFTLEKEYILCGAGRACEDLCRMFPDLKIKFLLDKQPNKQSRWGKVFDYEYLKTISTEEKQNSFYIITPSSEYASEIKQNLYKREIADSQIITLQEFVFFMKKKYQNTLYWDSFCFVPLTNCNLKCNGCIQYSDFMLPNICMNIDAIKEQLDLIFETLEIREFSVCGGEIFLHKDLENILQYLYEHYRHKFVVLQMFTNATVIPEKTILELMSKLNVRVYISNYHAKEQKIPEFCQALDEYNLEYVLNSNFSASTKDLWMDIGDPFEEHTEQDLKEKFQACSGRECMFIDGKLFCCNVPFSRESRSIAILPEGNDYIRLDKFREKTADEQFDLLGAFRFGYIEKGYYEACRYCKGYGSVINQDRISAGVQLENRKAPAYFVKNS